MTNALRALCTYVAMILAAQTSFAQPDGVESRRKALTDLLAERWEYTMRVRPVFASMLGDKRWNDKLEDLSEEAIEKDLDATKSFLARFEAIDVTGFPSQEALNKKLMVRDLMMKVEGARFKPWEMPVTQFGGIHISLPDMVNVLSFASMKDYDDYIARLKAIPTLFDQTETQMRRGLSDGLMPPRYLLEKVTWINSRK